MRRAGWLAAVAACAALTGAIGVAAFAADSGAKTINLQGSAIWNGNNKTANVTAVLTPTADKNTYDAAWEYTWSGAKNKMTGKVQFQAGGVVVGDGTMPDGKRSFIFRGKNAGGTITGQHWETTGGKEKLTGTMQFKM